jgi:hypothetical protein
VQPTGAVSAQTALEAFVLAVGPLPGVSAPGGRTMPIYTAGGPVRWLQSNWSELTPGQQSAASRYLRPPQPTAARGIALLAAGPIAMGNGDSPGAAPYRTIFDDAVARITAATGIPLLVTTTIVLGATPPPHSVGAWAYAEPMDAGYGQVGPEAHCFIFVNQRMVQADVTLQRATLAHEAFHCLQAQVMGSSAAYLTAPAWLIEGQAEWVGETYAGGTSISGQWWQLYLTKPLTPLFQRSYDAVGFYAHLEESGIDPWKRFSPMLTAGGSAAAYARAVAGHEPAFLDSWAAGLAREAAWGPGWNTTGPGITQDRPAVQTTTVGGFSDTVDPYTNNVSQVDLVADVVTFRFHGHGRLHTSDDTTYHASDLTGRSFCTKLGGCAGPGSCPAAARLPVMARGIGYLAMSAGVGATSFEARGEDLATFCLQPTPTPTLTPTPSPSPTAGGTCQGYATNADLSQALGGPVSGTTVTTDPPHGLMVCGFIGPTGRGGITLIDYDTYAIAIKDPRCFPVASGAAECAIGGNLIYMHARDGYFAIAVMTNRGHDADAQAALQLAKVVASH